MSDLDRLIKKNPAVLDLVRRLDLQGFKTTTLELSPDQKISYRVRSLINTLKAQYA